MKSEKLLKNYIYNTLYQILVLIAPIITTPYVSRVLGVTNIGIYNYVQSIATYFVLFGAMGTSLYGQREIAYVNDDREKRSNTFWEIVIFRIITVFLATLIYFVIFCFNREYIGLYRILIFEIIASAIDISWFYMGIQDFKITVIRNSIIKVIGIILVFELVKSKEDIPVYTVCLTVPILIGNISLWFGLKKHINVNFNDLTDRIKGISSRLKPILGFFIPQIALEVYLVLDKTMIGIFGSNIDQVGFYTQAQKIVTIILRIVTSLGTVMLPLMASIFAQGDLNKINQNIQKSFHFTLLLSSSLLFGIDSVAPTFVPFFLGEGYDLVVPLIYYISPIMIIVGISNVLGNQFLLPTKHQKEFTISIVSGACVNFTLNFILIRYFDAIGASMATVAAEATVALVQCYYVRKRIDLKQCFKPMLKYLCFGLIMFVCVRHLSLLNTNSFFLLVFQIVVGMIIYAILLIISKDEIISLISNKVLNIRK